MAVEKTHEERVAEVLAEKLRREPEKMRSYMAPPAGARKLKADKERELFWLRDEAEDEQALWDEFGQLAMADGVSPEEVVNNPAIRNAVAGRLYPHRLSVVRAGERGLDDKKAVAFVQRMLRLGPPEPNEPPMGAPMPMPNPTDMPPQPAMAGVGEGVMTDG